MRMHSHILRLPICIFAWNFLEVSLTCLRTVKSLARLCLCAGSLEPLLVAYVISTLFSRAGSNGFFLSFQADIIETRHEKRRRPGIHGQQRPRSDCTDAQSYQGLRCPLAESFASIKYRNTLFALNGFAGWFRSPLIAYTLKCYPWDA